MSHHTTRLSANKARAILRGISETEPGTLRAAVADEALEFFSDNLCQMFKDLACHGCQSGMISSLIYYADTHRFFDAFYSEIEAMRDAIEDEMGEPLTVRGDLKNGLAWFAFEETALRMAREDLGLDL
jgi:hypothetical protein